MVEQVAGGANHGRIRVGGDQYEGGRAWSPKMTLQRRREARTRITTKQPKLAEESVMAASPTRLTRSGISAESVAICPHRSNITKEKMSPSTVTSAYLDHKLALAKRCAREATLAGAKAAAVATVASAVPTLASVRMLPWAKANLNPTGQALIVCTVAGMAYFIVADKTIVSMARKDSYENAPEHLRDTSFHGAAASPRRPAFFRP
uniref:Uncharacterized protein n=1 Tax=Avena sativa TaxID=4498 RepID=A0ACD5ZP21_AVESA